MTETTGLFDDNCLQRFERLRLNCRTAAANLRVGHRSGRRVGGGQEFVDRRAYFPGDDFRHIDWGVYARHGDLLVRRFHEESELNVHLLIDCSISMGVGAPRKFDLARQIAGALSYVSLGNHHGLSILGFAGSVVDQSDLLRGAAGLEKCLSFIENLQLTDGPTELSGVLDGLLRTQNRGLVILISDMFWKTDCRPCLVRIRHAGFDVGIVQVYADEERYPTCDGACEFVGVEASADEVSVLGWIDNETVARYRVAFEDFLAAIRQVTASEGIASIQVGNEVPFEQPVIELLQALNG